MTSTFDRKGFFKLTDSPLTERDGPLPTKTYPDAFTGFGEPWTSQRSIWHTTPNSSAYGLGSDRRGVFHIGNGRTAKASEAARPGNHKIDTTTVNRVHSLHSANTLSSRSLEPLSSPTRHKFDGKLGVDANSAFASLAKLSLLSGSAPDIDSQGSLPSSFATRRSSTMGINRQFDVKNIAEFIPQHLQNQTGSSARLRGSYGVSAPHPTNEQLEWGYPAPSNVHDFPASPRYDQYSRADTSSPDPSYNGHAYDGRNDFRTISSSQDSWFPAPVFDPVHVNGSLSADNKTSRLRPDVAAYRPTTYHHINMVSDASCLSDMEHDVELNGTDYHVVTANQFPSAINANAFIRNRPAASGSVPEFYPRSSCTNQPTTSMVKTDARLCAATDNIYSSRAVPYDQVVAHSSRQFERKQPSYPTVFPEQVQMPQIQYNFIHTNLGLAGFNGPSFEMPVGGTQQASVGLVTGEGPLASEPPRSALLSQFLLEGKFLKQSPEKHPWPLKAIKNHVVEFCGDQLASRWIQAKMDQATSEDKDMLWTEIVTNARQLMSDNYANYVMQKMFEICTQAQNRMLANFIKGHMAHLSYNQFGCRVVQKAFQFVLQDQQAALIKELDGHVLLTVENAHGNHVIQKAIELIPGQHIQFIVDAHKNEVVRLSRHTFGCRVIQRILEYCSPEAKQPILQELHTAIPTLITDNFGNYVVQNIITKGSPKDREKVVACVQERVLHYSTHKFASNVVEKALEHAEDDQRVDMLHELTSPDPKNHMQTPVLYLIKDQFGNYVMQTVLKWIQGPAKVRLIQEIRHHLHTLGNSGYTKQVLAMSRALNEATCARSPSSSNGGPVTPPTPTSPKTGNIHKLPVNAVVEVTDTSHDAPSHNEPQFR